VDHRVEPPSWLPQEAAPQAASPEAAEAPASDDAPAPQDDSAPAQSTEELASGNGHDGSYTYTRDDSYSYAQGSPQVADGPQGAESLAESPQGARGPFEEAAKPPFHELPSAGFDQPPAPPPPGDELTGSGFVTSAATVGLPDSGLDDSGTDTDPADDGLSDGEFSGNGTTASLPDGDSADGAVAADPADNGLASAESLAAPYAPEFPPAPAPVATAGAETSPAAQQADSTTYAFAPPTAYTPPTPPPPPPPAKGRQAPTQARRANLILARLEPWSVMKFSFLISLVAWIVLFVAVALLYYALSSLGVFGALQKTLASVTSSQGSSGVDLTKWTSGTRILGYTMLIGAVDVVLITALSTLGAVVYNLVTHLGGGIEITLKETE
jgi:Transmembrane domain of unknown function (DUF3566)